MLFEISTEVIFIHVSYTNCDFLQCRIGKKKQLLGALHPHLCQKMNRAVNKFLLKQF